MKTSASLLIFYFSPLTPCQSSFPIPHARCGKKIYDLLESLDFFLLTH
jgi:hypothetical protein